MSSCDSDSSFDDAVYQCSCGFHHSDEESDYDDDEENDSFSSISDDDISNSDSSSLLTDDYDSFAEESSDNFDDSTSNLFICQFDKINDANENLICSTKEIKNYRDKYSRLSTKSSKNINIIWGDVKVFVAPEGIVPLKTYDLKLEEELKNKKKRFKKPSAIQIKKLIEHCANDEEATNKENLKEESKISNKKIDTKVDNINQNLNKKTTNKANEITQNETINTEAKDQSNISQSKKAIIDANVQTKNQKKILGKYDKMNIADKIAMTQKSLIETIAHKPNKASNNNKSSDITVNNNNLKAPNSEIKIAPKSETYIENTHYDLNDNMSKRKLKKLKQKEKKSKNINKDFLNPSSKNFSESNNKIKTDKSNKEIGQSSEFEEDSDIMSSNDEINLMADAENMPAFISSVVKRKKKVITKVKAQQTIKTATKKNEENTISPKTDNNQSNLARPENYVPNKNDVWCSAKLAEEGVMLVLQNNLSTGLEYILEAINYNPTDDRHYINRCYCYLRLDKNALALTDAQYVIKNSAHVGYKFIANIRAGQASLALQKYQHAEMYFKEAIYLNPENYHAQRELMRAKIARLVNMGFNERDCALALELHPSTTDAIHYLTQTYKKLNNSKIAKEFQIPPNEEWAEWVYSSDNDDEKPNVVEIVSRILKFIPGKTRLNHLIARPLNSKLVAKVVPKLWPKTPVNCETKKVAASNSKSSEVFKDKCIWVGSLTKDMTEAAIKSRFKQFGTVTSVYRPLNEFYAFIHFEKSDSVNKIMNYKDNILINEKKVLIQRSVRK